MCLIAFAWQTHPAFSLVLAGNRDEFHARPAAPLAFDAAQGIAGGVDLQAGGRWLGLSTAGRLAAVTNVRRGVPEAPRPRSRGALVDDMLRCPEPLPALFEGLSQHAVDFARFNLIAADGETLCYAGNADGWRAGEVEPGLHTLSNATLDTPWPKALWLRAELEQALGGLDDAPDADFIESLMAVLQSRQLAEDGALPDTGIGLDRERALSAPFVALGPYGTRCSSLVLQRRDGRWWFIEQRYAEDGSQIGRTLLSGDVHGLLG